MPSLSNFILYVILITHLYNPALPLSINDSLRTPVIATLPQCYLSPAFPTASEWVPCPTPWSERSSLLNIVPWGPVSPRWFGQRLCSWSSRWPRMSWPLLVFTHSSSSTAWSALLHLLHLCSHFPSRDQRKDPRRAVLFVQIDGGHTCSQWCQLWEVFMGTPRWEPCPQLFCLPITNLVTSRAATICWRHIFECLFHLAGILDKILQNDISKHEMRNLPLLHNIY